MSTANQRTSLLWALLAIVPMSLGTGACFGPEYGDRAFQCSSEGECPSGYECRDDGLCYRDGTTGGEAVDGDECAEALLLGTDASATGTVSGAKDSANYSCGTDGTPDIYYTFTIATERSVSLSLGSAFDSSLVLLTGFCDIEVQCVAETDVGEVLLVDSLPAGTYFVAVESSADGDFSLELQTGEPIVRPPNDTCEGAISLSDGEVRIGDSLTLALDDNATSCGEEALPDVAYTFTIPPGDNKRAVVTVSNADSFDPELSLSGPDCTGGELLCSQARVDVTETLDAPDLAPGTYVVWVGGDVSGPGLFDIGLQLLAAVPNPGNDDCSTADVLVEDVLVTSSTTGATDDLELMCLVSDSRDTVHQFTIAEDRAVLIGVEPLTDWGLSAALRDNTTCDVTGDVACVRSASEVRYINQPTLAAGTYNVIVDGTNGEHGDYSIVYETEPVDVTFGYRSVSDVQQFVALGAAATSLSVVFPDSDDEETFTVAIPFGFEFFGVAKTSVNIHTNGFLSFAPIPGGLQQSNFLNDCLDSTTPFDMIAVFWDDHLGSATGANPGGTQTLKHQVLGEAPNRRLVVEWMDFDLFDSATCSPDFSLCDDVDTTVSHQAILHENGDIEFRYGPRTEPVRPRTCATPHLGCGATIGLRNADGDDSDLFGCNGAALVDTNSAIRFIPPR